MAAGLQATAELPFNDHIGPHRRFDWLETDLADVKAVKKDFGVTVNDVLLALVGSALRHWLEERDELPDESLVALVPVSTRSDGDLTLGNQVTNVSVRWATDEPEPGPLSSWYLKERKWNGYPIQTV